jgi:hypothetical protein
MECSIEDTMYNVYEYLGLPFSPAPAVFNTCLDTYLYRFTCLFIPKF